MGMEKKLAEDISAIAQQKAEEWCSKLIWYSKRARAEAKEVYAAGYIAAVTDRIRVTGIAAARSEFEVIEGEEG